MNLFGYLKEIITIKKGDLYKDPTFKKEWNTFMIVRYLSMDNRFIQVSRRANVLQTTLNQEQMYKFLVKHVPQNKNSFIKYISKPKKQKEED